MSTEDFRPVKLFYSYSHKDKALRDELANHLGSRYILDWHDRDIVAGMDWAREIDTYLNSADIIVLLVSSDFLASKYCYGIEMKRAMERQTAGEAIVIPVILRAVRWQDEPFASLQVLPTGGKAVTSWVSRDEALFDVADGIHKAVDTILMKRAETRQYYLDEAQRSIGEGRPDDAYDSYKTALKLFPDDGSLYRALGDFLLAQKRYSEAVHEYDKALRLRFTHFQVYVNKGKALEHLERFDAAADAYRSALQLSDSDSSLSRDLGNVLFRAGHFREAAEAFAQAIKLSPTKDADLYTRKADALSMLGSYQEALDIYDLALEVAPKNAALYANKGFVLSALHRYSEAIEAYRQAVALDNRNPEFWRNMAVAFDADEHFFDAYEAYQEAIKRSPRNAFLYKEKGDVLVKLDALPEALTAYTDAIRLDNTFRFAYLARSELYISMARETYELYKRRLSLAREDQEAAQRLDSREE